MRSFSLDLDPDLYVGFPDPGSGSVYQFNRIRITAGYQYEDKKKQGFKKKILIYLIKGEATPPLNPVSAPDGMYGGASSPPCQSAVSSS